MTNSGAVKMSKPETKTEQSLNLKPDIQAAIEKARAIQAQQIDDINRRRKSPEGLHFRAYAEADPVTKFTNQYIDPRTEAGYTAPEELMAETLAKGYEPVLDTRGEHVRVGNSLGYKRRKEITEEELQRTSKLSKARMKAFDQQLGAVRETASREGIGKVDTEQVEVSDGD